MALATEQLSGAEVYLFYDPEYVNIDGTFDEEGSEVKAALEAKGHDVTTFTGTDADSWLVASLDADVIHIPMLIGELELSKGAIALLRLFVSNGGTLVFHSTYNEGSDKIPHGVNLINAIFKTELSEVQTLAQTTETGDAEDTTFEGHGPLPDNDGTNVLDPDDLPDHAVTFYENSDGSSVAGFQFGQGQVIYLGWDWYNALPEPGTQNTAWADVLHASNSTTDEEPTGNIIKGTKKNDVVGVDLVGKKFSSTDDDDIIDLGKGNDKAYGGDGSDVLIGGVGKDKLYGDEGIDYIVGGKQRDKLWGGDDTDYFIFDIAGNKHWDKIGDFDDSEDMFILIQKYFDELEVGDLSEDDWDEHFEQDGSWLLYEGQKVAKVGSGVELDESHFLILG